MITVYYGRAHALVERIGREACLLRIEERRKEKILRTGDEKSQVRSLATGVLLHRALCRYLGLKEAQTPPFQIFYEKEGKPYLADYSQVFYSISHSGEYVCCAVGDARMGVDIQKHVTVKEGIAERFFTKRDRQILERTEDETLFFRMWSVKESYIKYTGLGMKQGLNGFEIDWMSNEILNREGKRTACFEEFAGLSGYSMALCRESCNTEVIWRKAE